MVTILNGKMRADDIPRDLSNLWLNPDHVPLWMSNNIVLVFETEIPSRRIVIGYTHRVGRNPVVTQMIEKDEQFKHRPTGRGRENFPYSPMGRNKGEF
jgi:hypothetical protein